MNNHYAKIKYKGKKTHELQITQTRHPLRIPQMEKMSKFKYLSNVHKIGGAHLLCMNIHYANMFLKGYPLEAKTAQKN